jgi:hypothetical protein
MKNPEYEIDINGTKRWRLKGKLHREDGPAVEWADGDKEWWINGKRHREDGPAVECADGYKRWFLNGLVHREDGPALEFADGEKRWYLNGENFCTEAEYYKKLYELGKISYNDYILEMI